MYELRHLVVSHALLSCCGGGPCEQVLARIANAMQPLIPEASVRIEDPRQLQGGDDDAKSVEQFYAH